MVDPLTQQSYTVQVPKSSIVDPVLDLSSFDKIHTSTPYSGKADSSINWRNKQSRSNQSTPVRSLGVPPSSLLGSPAAKEVGSSPQVLTLEHLYEKFANTKVRFCWSVTDTQVPTKDEMAGFTSPKSSLSKGSTSAAVLKALNAANDSSIRQSQANVPETETATVTATATATASKSSPTKKKRAAANKTRNAASKAESSSPGASPQKGPAVRRFRRTAKSVAA